ncbi:hypothetical protein B0H17DRAFT_1209140 [Mycena rosella]|uniref:Uncharacterized protein n=1 Tax=Mycena rosella TaxID=1033263 RepID=A0AAD7GAE5_MYCRO|nr:hypothetical protein B0H17DRAFT_1209140 [Mycena rosella]
MKHCAGAECLKERLKRAWTGWFTPSEPNINVPIYELDALPAQAVPSYDHTGTLVAFFVQAKALKSGDSRVKQENARVRDSKASLVQRTQKIPQRSHPYGTQTAPILRPPAATAASKGRSKITRKRAKSESPSVAEEPVDIEWDGWPDGDFKALFPISFVEQHDNLRVHWASQSLGGRGGSTQADTWQGGKLTRRKCQGVIECEGDECTIVTRPQTRRAGLERQLAQPCLCGANLVHYSCDVLSTLHTFKDGIYYQNGGVHHHSRPTVRLHLAKTEREEFAQIVQDHPRTGALPLLVGRPGANGPGASVADISPVLVNADRIKYERRKSANPGFVRTSQLNKVAVIVVQTAFMASRLIKSICVEEDAVNGIVSDAAHGFWRERNSILIVSSTYEPVHLKCWVPTLISYSNGGTADHYRIHFCELFLSIAEESDARNIELTDELFANVLDFSTAERNGFILAFVDFWTLRAPTQRDVQELLETAPKLLKGCAQHFRNQITRVKKIRGVVDPSQRDVFHMPTNLSKPFRKLKPGFVGGCFPLTPSIPDTTNAEEAMHWKLYAALGKLLALLEGLKH